MIEGNCINIINLDSMTQSSRAKIYGLQLDFLSMQSKAIEIQMRYSESAKLMEGLGD